MAALSLGPRWVVHLPDGENRQNHVWDLGRWYWSQRDPSALKLNKVIARCTRIWTQWVQALFPDTPLVDLG